MNLIPISFACSSTTATNDCLLLLLSSYKTVKDASWPFFSTIPSPSVSFQLLSAKISLALSISPSSILTSGLDHGKFKPILSKDLFP